MRVLSMQGKVVWDILQRDKVYYADKDLARENNDYSRDIENLNGRVPIWCYCWPDINFYTMYDGEILNDLRTQMDLGEINCWDGFVLFELEIPRDELKIGQTYNASAYVKVFPELRLNMVRAVYTLRDAENPYFKIITPIWISDGAVDDIITNVELDFEQVTEYVEESTEPFIASTVGKCLWCGKEVSCVKNDKHFCCLAHMWKFERRFVRIAAREDILEQQARKYFVDSVDADFEHGVVRAVKKLKQSVSRASSFS